MSNDDSCATLTCCVQCLLDNLLCGKQNLLIVLSYHEHSKHITNTVTHRTYCNEQYSAVPNGGASAVDLDGIRMMMRMTHVTINCYFQPLKT